MNITEIKLKKIKNLSDQEKRSLKGGNTNAEILIGDITEV